MLCIPSVIVPPFPRCVSLVNRTPTANILDLVQAFLPLFRLPDVLEERLDLIHVLSITKAMRIPEHLGPSPNLLGYQLVVDIGIPAAPKVDP